VSALAQHEEGPILLPKPKPAAATLLVICDLACNWTLDGVAKGRIEAGGSAKVKVEFGQHLVAAATEDGLDKAEKELNIKAAGLTLARLELAPVRNARIKAEQEARDKAKPAEGAMLLVMCDLACDWKLDGAAKGHIDAGGSAKAKVELGQHLVAVTTEDGADQVQQLSEVKAEGQTVVSIELKPVRDARLKAEQEAQKPDPNDPASPHSPGIYMFVGTGADRKLVSVEPHAFMPKVYSSMAERVRAVGESPEATFKIPNAQPEFYFYFPEGGSGQNPTSLGTAVSPSGFVLLHFTVNKEGKREAPVVRVTVGTIKSAPKFLPPDRDHVSFNFSRIGPAAYKVTLSSPLTSGEYGFLHALSNAEGGSLNYSNLSKDKVPLWLFDFSVLGGQ
jgi:hypothetical protein